MGSDQKKLRQQRPFHFKQFAIRQDRCAMKVGTDGLLLGASVDLRGARTALDIGTGSGLIALMMAQRNQHLHITGVEVDHEAAEQALENFERSPWGQRIELVKSALQDYLPNACFDLIVSNPPFFFEGVQSPDSRRHLARHSDHLPITALLDFAISYLNPQGSLWLILPALAAEKMKDETESRPLYVHHIISIRPYPEKSIERVILSFGMQPRVTEHKEILLKNAVNGDWSDEYIALTKAFHPHF